MQQAKPHSVVGKYDVTCTTTAASVVTSKYNQARSTAAGNEKFSKKEAAGQATKRGSNTYYTTGTGWPT